MRNQKKGAPAGFISLFPSDRMGFFNHIKITTLIMEQIKQWAKVPTSERVIVVTLYAHELKCDKKKLNAAFNEAKPDIVFGQNEAGRNYCRVDIFSKDKLNRVIKHIFNNQL